MPTITSAGPALRTPASSRPSLSRGAFVVHMATLAAAGAFLVYDATKQWFYLDEWDFLVYRGIHLGRNGGLFAPHNEHWTTIPILIWRALFDLVGVRHYWLYAIPMILAHLAIVHLLWRLMLRHGVDPWTATLLVATFAVLAVGSENLTRAFQITFVGSVAFGFLAIDAIELDHTWLPALWGVCALMCSNIGVPMVFGCVLVALVRRQFAAAAVVGIVPGLAFVVWYLLIGHIGTYASTDIAALSFGGLVSYVWTGLTTSMGGLLDSSSHLGAVLVVVFAVAAVAKRNVPGALALTAVALYVFVGLGRLQYGVQQATSSRYSYIAVALCLPLIGQLLTMLTRRRDLQLIVVAGLVVLIGVNAVNLESAGNVMAASTDLWGTQIRAAAYLIHTGERFPGQETSSAPFTPPNEPSVGALTALIRRGQFPVPVAVSAGTVRAERAILGAFMSKRPGYRGSPTFIAPATTSCATAGPTQSVTARLDSSGSLRMATGPSKAGTTVTVSFPAVADAPAVSVTVPVVSGDQWLNIAAGAYPTVSLTASTDVRLCPPAPEHGAPVRV